MFNIMIVEDNEQIQNEIANILNINGYKAIKERDFDEIPKAVKEKDPHLILLDIGLPYNDGFKICTEIRNFSKVPIIFVTSRNTDVDELMSITLGGDDFITKPYNTQILLARINSILKRAYPNERNIEVIEYKGLKLNILTSTIENEENSIELTKNEFKIIHCLLNSKGKIVSRVEIMEYLWESALFISDNTLTVNMTRIRNKLQDIGVKDFIKTKRGQGYMV
ncbi:MULTISPECIES: response regulator transcription factor [Clostridium]|uniref:Stage 0 sporulation protein A homolog n=1 Tax=Clostridium senegalense TaxID=1465809 RepID=A0A6M0H0N1_9CLOT|nr:MULTISPECIES: response regulator transcription factor [Clostridium]NEU03694.1 response regulator transcription factor [Clostridium senegalense]